ncbi:MAG TPA: adenylate/guanylate cyclase domain-containing protein [Candidatus Dormibacteraeota bacterium]|nr:adenylate/guanylate cyclase domain-containing protein [Candidatus Dormibacteraeota bacterium]
MRVAGSVFRFRRSPKRFLATILFTDIVGSTDLAVRLGDRAWQRLVAAHHAAVRRELQRFRGREVDTAGDGFFATFDQPAQAVHAAGAIVGAVGKLGVPIRAGLHAGEAEAAGQKIGGIAVHIASRVMSAAVPGEVLVSGTLRDLVAGSGVEFSDRGLHQLKGVPGEWHLWALVLEGTEPSKDAIAGAVRAPAAAPTRPSLPMPDKPSIAVLPFTNLSGDPEQDYFADGMVEDIITGLSRIKWIFVIARNSSFAYRGKAMDVRQIGRELGVRYVLEGSVRRSANRFRITAQLIDTGSGAHIWADHYDRTLDDVFAVQDELTMSVVGVIEPTLRKAEIERARRKRPDSLDAYDLYLRALPLAFTAMPLDADKALALLDRAVELEPDYAAVHALIAWCHEQRYLRGGLHEEAKRAALEHARAAIAAGGDDAAALATAAFVIAVIEYDYKIATTAFDRSFGLSSSSALALGFSSIVRAWMGDDVTAVDQAERAIRLSPFDPLLYLPYLGLAYAHFAAGRFAEAADAAGRATQSNPRFTMPYVLHAAALANLGHGEEARVVADRVRELEPSLTVSIAIRSARFANPDKKAELGDALRRAGLPE